MILPLTSNQQQRGVALISSLIIMLLMTILALSVLRGNNLFEKIAGNTRDKQRAMQSAQDALLYGEWWLNNNQTSLTPVASANCTSTSTTLTAPQVCPTTNLFSVGSTLNFYNGFKPASMTVGSPISTSTIATALSDVSYYKNPSIYIAKLGVISGTSTIVYQVTAIGYGSANSTEVIVQSTFVLGTAAVACATCTTTNLSTP